MQKIFKGDDTFFNGQELLGNIEFETTLDLTGWTAKFILCGVVSEFDDITGGVQPSYTKEQTVNFNTGNQNATLELFDTYGKKQTEFNDLVYYITNRKAGDYVNQD